MSGALKGDDIAINYKMLWAVRQGMTDLVRELCETYGLSYSAGWSAGYVLLKEALENGHADVAKLLLELNAKVNSKNQNPADTPLHLAASKGCTEVVKMLLCKAANLGFRNKCGETPLHYAVEGGNIEVAKLLVNNGAYVNECTRSGSIPLCFSVRKGDVQMTEYLLSCGGYVNHSTSQGFTLLHDAVKRNLEEIAELLLRNGANVNARSYDKAETPLYLACTMRRSENLVQLLLGHGAEVDSVDNKGRTPLHLAAEIGNAGIVEMLLSKGSNINAREKENLTPIHVAVAKNHDNIVKILLEHGADINAQDKDGNTILCLAVKKYDPLYLINLILSNSPDVTNDGNRRALKVATLAYYDTGIIIDRLLGCGLSVRSEDTEDQELLHKAIEKGFMNLTKHVLNQRQNVDTFVNSKAGGEGLTALHVACKYTRMDMVEELIKYGADVNAESEKKSETPIFFSIRNGDLDITKVLLLNKANVKKYPELLNLAAKTRYGKKKLNEEIVELLLKFGADVNARDETGKTAIYYSVGLGDIKVVNMLLESDAIVQDYPDILPKAVTMHNKELIEKLLKKGADPNGRDKTGNALHRVISEYDKDCKNLGIAELLLNSGTDANAKSSRGKAPLTTAIEIGHEKLVEVLIEYGADVNATDVQITYSAEGTPLILAASKQSAAITEMLLNKGAQVNSRVKKSDITALHMATIIGSDRIVDVLLKHPDIEVDCLDKDGNSPLYYAALNRKCATSVRNLLQSGADVNHKGCDGKTPLHCAAGKGHQNSIYDLIKHRADIGATDKHLKTPLHYAAEMGSAGKVLALLEYNRSRNLISKSTKEVLPGGAYLNMLPVDEFKYRTDVINFKDNDGKTPLHYAVKRCREEFSVEQLLYDGADVNCKDNEGNTPLHYAAALYIHDIDDYDPESNESHHYSFHNWMAAGIRSVLLRNGADPDIQNDSGETALHTACRTAEPHDFNTVQFFLDHGADVNICAGNRTPLQFVKYGFSSSFKNIQRHIIKLHTANSLCCNQSNVDSIDLCDPKQQTFESECSNELADLKKINCKLGEINLSFYDILTRKRNHLCRLLRGESLSNIIPKDYVVSDENILSHKSLYGKLIIVRSKMLLKRFDLLDNAYACFRRAFPFLPDVCIDLITDYLSNNELKAVSEMY